MTNAARAAVSPTPASIGKMTSYALAVVLFRSLARVMPIFSFCAHTSCVNGLSTLTPMTSALRPASAEAGGEVAHFLGADAGEREREEQQHGVLLAEVVAEFHVHEAGGLLGLEGEVGGFGSVGIGIIVVGFVFNFSFLAERYARFRPRLSNQDCADHSRNKST